MSDSDDLSMLFTPAKIGRLTIPNRFVRSATHDFLAAEDGQITPAQLALYGRLAEGEVGLIITGHAYVHPAGKASPRQIAASENRFIPGLAALVQAVHRYPSKIFLQVAHAGRQTRPKDCGCTPLGPSAVFEPTTKVMPREMTEDDIQQSIGDFVRAAGRAVEAGFDGVQLHMAHGYLLSSFLSPHTNRRSDLWGGPLRNRLRIALEILRAIKNGPNPGFPVIAKMNSTDLLAGGLTLEDCLQAARALEAEGLDGLELSGGMAEAGRGSMWPGLRPEEEEGYFVEAASRVKAAVKIPVFGLGGIRSLRIMARIISQGRADFVSLSRPFVREPDLVRRLRRGLALKSECISCNKCLNPRGLRCAELKR
jgi:2,4-dienoyl-CoA reductase-like NADH-dependent reductase (Old Yellow Enzyme family)